MTDLSGPAEQWRLVDPMDAQDGDEYLTERYNWEKIECLDCDLDGLREHLKMFGLIVRRRPDPHEPLRRELREAYGLIYRVLKEMLEGGNSPRPHECAEWLARNADHKPKEEQP